MLNSWPYEPGKITVRTIIGRDGREKVQMRLDLGLLQMELDGRPDGERPKGRDSLLDYHLDRLAKFEEANGTDLGFALDSDACKELRDEALMFYHRYLSLFVLEDYDRVERDTARNLRVLDLCNKYAAEELDRLVLEQYRPYIVMMNTRAKALKAMQAGMYKSALAHVDAGLRAIEEFFGKYNREDAFAASSEVQVLQGLRQEVVQRMPIGPVERLERKLQRAIDEERYEDAAHIRDQIRLAGEDAETEV